MTRKTVMVILTQSQANALVGFAELGRAYYEDDPWRYPTSKTAAGIRGLERLHDAIALAKR